MDSVQHDFCKEYLRDGGHSVGEYDDCYTLDALEAWELALKALAASCRQDVFEYSLKVREKGLEIEKSLYCIARCLALYSIGLGESSQSLGLDVFIVVCT